MTEVVRKSALKGRFGGRGKRPREGDSGAALAESAASGHTSKPARRDNVQQPSQQVHFQLHSYAMMLEMQGDLLGAKQQYLEALKVKPDFAECHCNLGNTLKLLGRVDEAEQSYRTALKHDPKLAAALGNLGAVLYEKGDMATAQQLIENALALRPELPDAWNHLGNLMRDSGNPQRAIEAYQRALAIQPGHPHALNNLGNALKDVGRRTEARECYIAAIRALPSSPAPHTNIAALYKEHGDIASSLLHFEEALRLCPSSTGAYCNLAAGYKESARASEALSLYSHVLTLDPNHLDALNQVGTIFKEAGRLEEAVLSYAKALSSLGQSNELSAGEILSNLAHTLLFLADYSHSQVLLAQIEALTHAQLRAGLTPSVQPFHALVYPLPLRLIRQISVAYGTRCDLNVAGRLAEFKSVARPVIREPDARLRVGYVSSDFVNHPLAHLMQSAFGMHNRHKFEVFCFSLTANDGSTYYQKISSQVEHFVDVSSMHTIDIAKLINSFQIHVLFNLNGYTKGARNEIFALQPAPVQVSYMGFCGTMGSSCMQYMVTDAVACPLALASLYTEKLVHMPHSYFVNDHMQSNSEVLAMKADMPPPGVTRASLGLPDDKIVLCNFNQLYKIDSEILDVWSDVLKRLPQCVIWLLRFPVNGERGIRRELLARGVDEAQIIFTDVVSKRDHINRGVLADLFVDTLQCNAHTTACDILWTGTPLVTMPKTKMSCRVAASLLTALACPELITDSLQGYINLIVDVVSRSSRELVQGVGWRTVGALAEMREDIERKRTVQPLFDTRRWVQNLECGIELMWHRHETGLPPEHIKVPDVRDGEFSSEPVLSQRELQPAKDVLATSDAEDVPILDKMALVEMGRALMQRSIPSPQPQISPTLQTPWPQTYSVTAASVANVAALLQLNQTLSKMQNNSLNNPLNNPWVPLAAYGGTYSSIGGMAYYPSLGALGALAPAMLPPGGPLGTVGAHGQSSTIGHTPVPAIAMPVQNLAAAALCAQHRATAASVAATGVARGLMTAAGSWGTGGIVPLGGGEVLDGRDITSTLHNLAMPPTNIAGSGGGGAIGGAVGGGGSRMGVPTQVLHGVRQPVPASPSNVAPGSIIPPLLAAAVQGGQRTAQLRHPVHHQYQHNLLQAVGFDSGWSQSRSAPLRLQHA